MSAIHVKEKLTTINNWTILLLPKDQSLKLPSRGQVMVKGTINKFAFQTALEPDGRGSHWLHVDAAIQKAAKVVPGDTIELVIESTKDWPEPLVPADINAMVNTNAQLQKLWARVTPMARWEWIRWINSTSQPQTRKSRIEVAKSKLLRGKRRPCCFNRSMCCVPDVSKNGLLIETTAMARA